MRQKYLPLLILILLTGCQKQAEPPVAPTPVARFTPPPDGKLTEQQVQLFLEIRPREKQLADETGDPSADARAAREMGRDPAEYQWIKGRIAEAVLARVTADWEAMDEGSRRALLDGMEKVRDTLTDREDRAALERRIAQLRGTAPAPAETAALRHNVDVVARHQEEMLRVEVWSLLAEGEEEES